MGQLQTMGTEGEPITKLEASTKIQERHVVIQHLIPHK